MKVKLLFLLFFATLFSFAQNPTDVEHNFGAIPGCSGPVQKMVVQQDGKIIVQASAQFFNGIQRKKALIRINADGSLDPTFDYNPVTNIFIKSFALQPDGKILVGGFKGDLFRINTDGSTDTSFNSTLNFEKDSYINCIAVQPDGKILVTNTSDYSQWVVPLKYLTRLNADGSIDSTFSIGTGFFNNPINALAVQSDGKILVVSQFSNFEVNAQKNLIRLNADGTKDTSFDIGTGFNGYIISMILQNDGKIIVGGNFSFYQGIAQLYLIRLNTDGSKDTSFINPSNFKYFNDRGAYDVSDICLQTDGKIIVNFHTSNESSSTDDDFIYRFNSDGSIDTSFAKVNFNRGKRPLTPYYYDADVHTIAVLNNGKIIIGGEFSFCQKVIENNIVFLNADGSKDSSFYKETGFDNWVRSTAIQTDGKTLVAGDFDNFKGVTQPELIRLNTNGSIDTSFKLDGVFKGGISSILLQADGKILAMGPFENYVNIGRNYLVRLNPDGSLDTSFKKIFEFEYFVEAMALQPDGKILLSAFVDNWPNLPYKKLFRLNTDGSEDISFDAGNRNDFSKGVYSIVVQNDGKILVGGVFTKYNNITQKYLIRLNPDGSKDTSFDVGTIFDFSIGVKKITLQPDGKILVNGAFSPTTGDYQSFLIRLNSDGSKDVSFNQGTGLDSVVTASYDIEIRSVVLQNDGKILVGGEFDTYQGIAQNRLTRLNIDGSIDTSFDIGTGFDAPVESISLYPDGKIIVGGAFSSYRGVNSSPYLIRLKGTSVQPTINATTIQTNLTCPDNSTGSASIVSVYNGKSPYSYLWSNGATTATINGLAAGNYSCTITDADSSTVTKSFIIIIDSDFQKPTITAPATLTVNANGNCTATGVVLGTPVTTDNCTISSVTNNAPSVFPIGNTTVTWTVKDASNNDATATQIIIVKDVTKPTIFPPAKITVNTTSNCTATGIVLGTPVTADNCSVVSVTNNAPTTFQLGNTTVTWTVKDASNNTATATQIVTVKETVLPTITAPPTVIVNADLNGTATGIVLGTPITADNCSVASVTNNAPTTFQLGNTTVTWTVKDASNNTATATQIVTVKNAAPTTLIPDVNFEKKLIALGIDSGVVDGKVLTSSISSLTSLDVSSSSIKDMTGIQDFVALTSLTCYSNQLTFLDISKNVALSSLLCYLNQLTSLDISRNVALKTLTCSSNQLTSLDISQNVALTRLSCNSNQLTSLDVSKNVALTTLVFDSNQLTTLDISKNTKLIALYCISNKLTSLDVSKNVALKDLFCYSNQLKSLDVSNNTALENLLCQINQLTVLDVYKNTSLKLLDCSSNKLITLDISDNVSLFALNCNSNQLINLNLRNGNNTILANSKSSNFANNPNLTCIEVDNVTYSNTNWATLKDAAASYSTSCTVQKYTLIPDLNFEKKLIALGIDSGTTDGKVLTSNISSLTSLDVSSSSISNLTGIQDCVSLTNLNCYNNQLTNLDISKNTALTSLYCFSNKLTTLDVSTNLALTSLYCASNQLTILDISKNIALTGLSCSNNQISVLDVSKNVALKSITCNSNQLKSLDVSKNTSLTVLNCDSNQLINLDLRNGNNTILSNSKASSFTNNPNLTCIQVDNVTYSNANWTTLKDATASYNPSCAVQQYTLIPDVNFEKKLIALGIDSGTTDGKVLTSSISSLTSLNVSSSSIKDLTGVQYFVDLTNLNCFNNQLTTLDVSKNIALTSLDCSYNYGLNALDLSKNITLTSLKCNDNSKLLTLDVSKILGLTDLECSYVNLTTLDVSKNTSLLALKCFNNKLTTLDVTKNSALKFLNCESNQLSAIDVSNNVALDTLRCNSNKLIELDVSKNINLKRLFCSNNKLESLNLKNGNNSKIDVNNYNLGFSYNPDLTCIQVDDKTYSDANWSTFKDATASYSENCSPSSIIVSSEFEDKLIALGIDKDGKNGSVLLASITNVTSIDVSNSGITNLSGIEYFTALETLICNGNVLTAINLSNNTVLKYLDCSSNPLTSLDVSKNRLLVELLCNGITIKLNKINNAKTSVTTQLTVLDLSNNLFLTKLSCANNQLVSLDVSKNTLLTDLDCSNNSLQNLNVSNGNNTKMLNVNFKSNSSLSCIKVDDEVYSNANWAGTKDTTAIYSKTTCTLGVGDVVSDKISIYPNPVKGQLHIDNIMLEKVTVYDALGKLIKTIKFTNASVSNTVDLNGLTKGVYFIYLESQGANSARKIIIE